MTKKIDKRELAILSDVLATVATYILNSLLFETCVITNLHMWPKICFASSSRKDDVTATFL